VRLKAVAALHHLSASSVGASPELALLAVSAQSDPFGKVIKAIDELAEKLKAEQEDEVKQKDFCVSELNENTLETARKNALFESLEAKIADLDEQIKTISKDIETLKAEVADLQVELQTAGEQRQASNLEFQKVLREQRTTRNALEEAHKVLASVYLKKNPGYGASLLQEGPGDVVKTIDQLGAAGANVAPAPEFKPYKQHEGKNSVLGVIQKLIGETKVIEDGSNHDEQQAQIAYEKLVSDTNDSVKAKLRLIGDKTEELASTKEARAMAASDKEQTGKDLEGLADTKASLEKQCNFLLKNFAARQEARAAEIEGLRTVKAIFSGMQGS
jgi:chromosome segregation ATPase